MSIEVLHRGRFHEVPDATARAVGANAWEISIPLASPIHARVRRGPDLEAWDGAVFSLDGVEMQPGLASGVDAGAVRITVLHL